MMGVGIVLFLVCWLAASVAYGRWFSEDARARRAEDLEARAAARRRRRERVLGAREEGW